ncbi:unnamed protein product [Bursaphelenchus okinawaensis]|uniref:Uncharacterized protein n=1 Tax=Bursaphelenchus okinawaensis TaxID=465554 RepID=A0A811KSI6_9BILA|nr:unnamed protein product [Bursaphelenchus okinawaensis]CAG9109902.1 unnamed protein product [Bursaphelenchus okinawaensis]
MSQAEGFLTEENIAEDAKQHEGHHVPLDDTTETVYSTDTDPVLAKSPVRKTSEAGKSTPAIQRLHKTLNQITVHSPSDNIMSPCSQRINLIGHRKLHGSQPANILKRRFKKDIQSRKLEFGSNHNSDEELEDKENPEIVPDGDVVQMVDSGDLVHQEDEFDVDVEPDLENGAFVTDGTQYATDGVQCVANGQSQHSDGSGSFSSESCTNINANDSIANVHDVTDDPHDATADFEQNS